MEDRDLRQVSQIVLDMVRSDVENELAAATLVEFVRMVIADSARSGTQTLSVGQQATPTEVADVIRESRGPLPPNDDKVLPLTEGFRCACGDMQVQASGAVADWEVVTWEPLDGEPWTTTTHLADHCEVHGAAGAQVWCACGDTSVRPGTGVESWMAQTWQTGSRTDHYERGCETHDVQSVAEGPSESEDGS